MATRLAACDPCRRFKVACDHNRPVCTRCLQSDRAAICSYRASPFKRRRHEHALRASSSRERQQSRPLLATPPGAGSPQSECGPNSGHLGPLSHSSLYDEIKSRGEFSTQPVSTPVATSPVQDSSSCAIDFEFMADRVAQALQQLLARCSVPSLKDLVVFWLAKGVNLALAEPLVQTCVETMDYLQTWWIVDKPQSYPALVTHLLNNSRSPLTFDVDSTLSSFLGQFRDANARLETLGIFALALIRATMDIPFFPSLYQADEGRYVLRHAATRLSDCIVALCLLLDSPNDLQFVLQYEHFIVHSSVSGDQSLRCWQCLGEVISSAFALGYHENMASKPDVPPFLVELRTTAFARVYFNDKSFAIFLGRPPRMSKRFVYFQIPSGRRDWDAATAATTTQNASRGLHEWDPAAHFSYRAEARWSALCASLKEEILELLLGSGCEGQINRKANDIATRAEALWLALPPHFRLAGNLNHVDKSPFERDFLVGARLNYLQIHFLLHLAQLPSLANPSSGLVDVAEQILALVVEAVLSRDYLANAGSSITWKVSQFGLPAAGVMLLAALRQRRSSQNARSLRDRSWQQLSIFAAEVSMGSVVPPREPNRALLLTAAHTIQCVLDRRNTPGADAGEASGTARGASVADQGQSSANGGLGLGLDAILGDLSPDPWNMEMGFWQDLAECRFLGPQDFPTSSESHQVVVEGGTDMSPEYG